MAKNIGACRCPETSREYRLNPKHTNWRVCIAHHACTGKYGILYTLVSGRFTTHYHGWLLIKRIEDLIVVRTYVLLVRKAIDYLLCSV